MLCEDDFGGYLWDETISVPFEMLSIELSRALAGVLGLRFDLESIGFFSCYLVEISTFVIVDGWDMC